MAEFSLMHSVTIYKLKFLLILLIITVIFSTNCEFKENCFLIFLERNPSPDGFEKKNMSRSMNPPVPTNRWSVSPTNSAPSIPPLQR